MLDDRLAPSAIAGPENICAGSEQRVVHGDIDVIATPGLLAPQQRHQHAGEPLQRAHDVGDRNAGDRRPAVVAEREAESAGQGFQREIVRRAVAVGAVLSESRDGAIDDAAGCAR